MTRHLLSLLDLNRSDVEQILDVASALKTAWAKGERQPYLAGRVLALLFQKQSLRTRVSFEAGMAHLGGSTMFLGQDVGWGKRESMSDFSRVLSEYLDVLVVRANSHSAVETLAQYSSQPVINGLTDRSHPCQAIADIFTMREIFGDLSDRKLAYIGDANNVAHSLLIICAMLEIPFAIGSPVGYEFDPAFLERVAQAFPSYKFQKTNDPFEAADGASAVYTDVWTSMGQEAEAEARKVAFAPFQVNAALMRQAASDAIFLHCLPARRGEEVSEEVIDGEASAIVQQAGNRMHAQKGVLVWALEMGDKVLG